MKNRKIFILAVMLSMTVGSAWAQLSVTGWASPQSDATQGRYRSNADNFIRPDSWSGIKFDKFFAMTSYKSTNTAHLGLATKIKSAYLGVYYGGSFWANYYQPDYTEQNVAWPDTLFGKNVPVYNTVPAHPTNTPYKQGCDSSWCCGHGFPSYIFIDA